ncbi:MAG: hypothetical protein U1E02_33815 [Hydrogenophaga sp.]|nr:hypothetical protein [Hydrogenophaga sp.]
MNGANIASASRSSFQTTGSAGVRPSQPLTCSFQAGGARRGSNSVCSHKRSSVTVLNTTLRDFMISIWVCRLSPNGLVGMPSSRRRAFLPVGADSIRIVAVEL